MFEGNTIMKTPDLIILYVRDVPASLALYSALLGTKAVDSTPGFALLPFREGVMLGLWQASAVKPAPTTIPGGFELCLHAADEAALRARFAEWQARPELSLEEAPVQRDFGLSFVMRDPDGNRLRMLLPPVREAAA